MRASDPIGCFTAENDPASIATLVDLGLRRRQVDACRSSSGVPTSNAATSLPEPALPAGYRIRPLAGPHEVPARVEVHRAAFPPSRLNVEKYERLLTLPHYRFEDDLVVEAPDGSLAAFAMAWWDEDARVGEFEPVGTHPDHQRRGLARALLSWGLDRYAERDARVVQVYSDASNAASEALYAGRRVPPPGVPPPVPATRRPGRRVGPGPDLQSGP